MNALKFGSECRRHAHALEPYVDSELDPGHALDVEVHLAACETCAERVALARAMRVGLRRMSKGHAPAALRSRICATMMQERTEEETREGDGVTSPKLIQRRYAVALAAAAGIVFALGASRNHVPDPTAAAPIARFADTMTPDSWLDSMVAMHADPLPPEMTNPEELPRFDPFVGVPVRRPASVPFGANFNGARLNANMSQRTAVLQYTVDGKHRFTMYVFNPRTVPVESATHLSPRRVHEHSVYVGRLRGYSVAAVEQSGIGYAVASDFDDEKSAEMVVEAALRQQ